MTNAHDPRTLEERLRRNELAEEARELVAEVNRKADAHRPDMFDGDDAHLLRCIDAFLDLTDEKAFVPHNLDKGSHAYVLLNAAYHRLASLTTPAAHDITQADAETAREALDRITAQASEMEQLRRNVRGWVEWHRRCDADDDCTYLNDNAWCDADALASTGMGLLARANLEQGGR